MTDLPQTMNSVLLDTTTLTLSLSTSHPIPIPKPSEHLVRVHASGLTNSELTWSPFTNWPAQHIPTYDLTGTVLNDVPDSPFSVGDEVYGHIDAYNEGAAAEYAVIFYSHLARKPKNLTWEEAATVPTSALTAWQGLFTQAGLEEPKSSPSDSHRSGYPNQGKRVLITAASGGVGIFAVQLAKLAGAYVVGTCGPSNIEFVRGLGADEVINYRETSIKCWITQHGESAKFDVILNCAADFTNATLHDAAFALAEEGRLVSIIPGYTEPEGGLPPGAKGWFFILQSLGWQLERMNELIERVKLRTKVDSVWRLEEFREAFERVGTGRARGKVVFKVL